MVIDVPYKQQPAEYKIKIRATRANCRLSLLACNVIQLHIDTVINIAQENSASESKKWHARKFI